MKARWMHRSLRLRITPTELHSLVNGMAIREGFSTADSWLVSVEPGAETRLIVEGPRVTVFLTSEDLAQLAEPDREGLYFISEHRPAIRYCIEKDFPCVHPRAPKSREPETETFPAPSGFKKPRREP